MITFKQLLEQNRSEIDAKKVWNDFTRVSTNRPSKSDIKTLKYKTFKKKGEIGVEVNWGDYKHLGGAQFGAQYINNLGVTLDQFIDWLESQGVSK